MRGVLSSCRHDVIALFRWSRVIGDTVFTLGVLVLAVFIVKVTIKPRG